MLGFAQALVILLLVWVELAEPPSQPGLQGFIFSNAVSSGGATNAMHMYRDRLSFLPLVGDDHVLTIGFYQWARKVGFVLLAALQLAAIWAVLRQTRPSIRRWLIGPTASVLILVLYPPINTDVFYYASVGQVANNGENPYFVSPREFGRNVFDRYSDWEHITVPYGPIWVWISRGIDVVTDSSPFWASLLFKVVLGIASLGLAYVTALLARRLTGDVRREVLAFVLVAWSPIVIYESAGTAHLDPLLMLVALSGLLLLTTPRRGAIRGGLIVIALSALFKPVTVPLLGSAALIRLAWRNEPLRAIAKRWAVDVAAILALVYLVMFNIWEGGRVIGEMLSNQRQLYVEKPLRANPFWFWLARKMNISWGWLPIQGPNIAQGVASLVVAVAVVWLIRRELRLRRNPEAIPPTRFLFRWQVQTWTIVMVALAYIPPNSHAWYMIWALPLMSLILVERIRLSAAPVAATNGHAPVSDGRFYGLPWWLLLYFCWSFVSFFVYHTLARG